jgi:hypothetical protein
MSDERGEKRKWHLRCSLVAIFVAGCWFLVRAGEYGLSNVFFRDHHFTDDRQLTEDVAIDLTKRTLVAEGIEVSAMEPQRFWTNDPRLFARNTINPNQGYVLWGNPQHGPMWEYHVNIKKNGSDVRCRVYRPK